MNYFKTTFERYCFGFGKKVAQSFDVVFAINENEPTEENREKFASAAMTAFDQQVPISTAKASELPLGQGWSSVMANYKYIKLNMPWLRRKLQMSSRGKPVIGCSFSTDKHSTYRATGFYKIVKSKHKPSNYSLMQDSRLALPKWTVVPCLPKEAQIVSGDGISGYIGLIKNVKVGSLVRWSDNSLKQAQWNYDKQLKFYRADPNYCHAILYLVPEWVKELGLPERPE
ncbi:MAG: hypothetical protein WCS56_00200 [Bacilli bacterium]